MTISLLRAGAAGEIHVRDTGAGIDPALLSDLFLPFTQAKQTLARTEGGLGLGLAFVKGLVELHGGTVTAASEGPGRGSHFTVSLPAVRPARVPAPEGTPPAAAPAPQRRVLVVDDNRDAAETLAELLRMLGHDVQVAFDGPAAIEQARRTPPEVVRRDRRPGAPLHRRHTRPRQVRRPDTVQRVTVRPPRPSCRTCRYAVKARAHGDERAECRRYPPSYGESAEARFRIVDFATSPWCGEYQPRDASAPASG